MSAQLQFAYADQDTLSMAVCGGTVPLAPDTLQLSVLLDVINGAECRATLTAEDSQWNEEDCDALDEEGEGDGARRQQLWVQLCTSAFPRGRSPLRFARGASDCSQPSARATDRA